MKPGDLVKVSDTYSYDYTPSIEKIVGVDYFRRELHDSLSASMLLKIDGDQTLVPVDTQCIVLETQTILVKYIAQVVKDNYVDDWSGLDGSVETKYRHRPENRVEYGYAERTFSHVLTPKSIGWIRTDVLILA